MVWDGLGLWVCDGQAVVRRAHLPYVIAAVHCDAARMAIAVSAVGVPRRQPPAGRLGSISMVGGQKAVRARGLSGNDLPVHRPLRQVEMEKAERGSAYRHMMWW
jgi:hypothetical protein